MSTASHLFDVVVVGAGAAGLIAAERAASRGLRTLLLEKNRKPGVKILMSGGTRCNLTHATDARGIVAAFGAQGRFLHSALAALSPAALVELVESQGVPTKIEETGKIFPSSDKATDVLGAFLSRLQASGCPLALDEPLLDLKPSSAGFALQTSKRTLAASRVIVTVGGKSYPGCGTRGDGYAWARQLGHTLVPLRPALVPLISPAPWIAELRGITLPHVRLRVIDPSPPGAAPLAPTAAASPPPQALDERAGALLFAHFGLTGPAVLDISRAVTGHPRPDSLLLECDFLPDLRAADLESQLQKQAASGGKRPLASVLPDELPRRLREALLVQARLSPDSRLADLSRPARAALVALLKKSLVPLSGSRGYEKAEVTAGGVSLSEVDSRTLQSKLIPGLYWAGEVLDLDGPIGGYNFQAAFSTGWLAGSSV